MLIRQLRKRNVFIYYDLEYGPLKVLLARYIANNHSQSDLLKYSFWSGVGIIACIRGLAIAAQSAIILGLLNSIYRSCRLIFAYKTGSIDLNSFSARFKTLAYNNILIGDCVLAEHLRDPKLSSGYIRPGLQLLLLSARYAAALVIAELSFVYIINKYNSQNIITFFLEPTYLYHCIRRLAFYHGINKEFSWSPSLGRAVVTTLTSPESIRNITLFAVPSEHSESDLANAKYTLYSRLYTGSQAHTSLRSDVNVNLTVPFSDSLINRNKKTIILCLHQTADQQFVFGMDDFHDISCFHQFVVDTALELDIRVFIKPHPNSFSKLLSDKSHIDNRYLNEFSILNGFKHLLPCDFFNSSEFLYPSTNPNIFMLNPFYSSAQIAEALGHNIVFITKHGNVYLEANALHVPCFVCENSRFRYLQPHTVFKNRSELLALLCAFRHKNFNRLDFIDKNWPSIMASTIKSRSLTWQEFEKSLFALCGFTKISSDDDIRHASLSILSNTAPHSSTKDYDLSQRIANYVDMFVALQ